MLTSVNKDTIESVALWFYENSSLSALLQSYKVVLENGHGTFFLQSKTDENVRFNVHKNNTSSDKFALVSFYDSSCKTLSIKQLMDIYSLYSTSYIPYDDEHGFAFESKNGKYKVMAYVGGDFKQEADMELAGKLLRLSISWD